MAVIPLKGGPTVQAYAKHPTCAPTGITRSAMRIAIVETGISVVPFGEGVHRVPVGVIQKRVGPDSAPQIAISGWVSASPARRADVEESPQHAPAFVMKRVPGVKVPTTPANAGPVIARFAISPSHRFRLRTVAVFYRRSVGVRMMLLVVPESGVGPETGETAMSACRIGSWVKIAMGHYHRPFRRAVTRAWNVRTKVMMASWERPASVERPVMIMLSVRATNTALLAGCVGTMVAAG